MFPNSRFFYVIPFGTIFCFQITVKLRGNAAAGLGSAAAIEKSIDAASSKNSSEKWQRAQVRYQQLQPVPSVFADIEDEEDETAIVVPGAKHVAKKTSKPSKPPLFKPPSAQLHNQKKIDKPKWVSGGTN